MASLWRAILPGESIRSRWKPKGLWPHSRNLLRVSAVSPGLPVCLSATHRWNFGEMYFSHGPQRHTKAGGPVRMTAHVDKNKKRVFLVDDHPLVREWLTNLINQQPDLTVCGEAESAPQAIGAIAAAKPDV